MIKEFIMGVAVATIVLVSGCEYAETSKPISSGSAAAVEAGQQSIAQSPALTAKPVDLLAPRYEATLADGIDFSQPGYPSFLAEVSGVSSREGWGRWTDANQGDVVRFRFKQRLPDGFILEIKARAFGPNAGVPVKVRVGDVEQSFTPSKVSAGGFYQLTFRGTGGADSIGIIPPQPVSPKDINPDSKDARKIGVGLISLKIQPISG